MVVDYKIVNGTQVAVISDIENANLTAEQWKQFADMIVQRYEEMLPTVTILGVDYSVLKRIIENKCKDAFLAHVIVGRLWEMGVKKIDYLPISAQPNLAVNADKKEKSVGTPAERTSKARDYCINGGRGYGSKVVQQLDGNGAVVREFPSASAAARYYNISYEGIRMCCYGKCKTSGGRIWKYKEA